MPEFNKKAKWLEPFYEEVKSALPKSKLKKITTVKLVAPPPGYTTCFGVLTHYHFSDHYTIWLVSHARRLLSPGQRRHTLVKLNVYELLDNFAHELAHLHHHYHTPAHQKLTYRIASRFMTLLEKYGFESLEDDPRSRFHERYLTEE